MCIDEPVNEAKDRRLCLECVTEQFLRAKIKETGDHQTCFYCKQHRETLSVEQIAKLINDGISEFFEPPAKYGAYMQAMLDELAKERREESPARGRLVAEVIKEEAGLTEIVAEDIRRVLVKRHDEILTSVFEGIDESKTTNGQAVIVPAGPGTGLAELYRARVFQSEDKLEEAIIRPDRHVGPPPSFLATAGRMNAAGIAVFYGATSPEVALHEVRPPVGSKVLIGRFEVVQNLKLLNLDALEHVAGEHGSIFDPSHIYQLKKTKFLRSLCKRISRIVMPNDEPREYVPTQAVADFLANMEIPSLDGVIYPSAQTGPLPPRGIFGRMPNTAGSNVVLFHKAAVVQEMIVPERTKVWGPRNSLFDLTGTLRECDPAVDYTVEEIAPSKPLQEPNDSPLRLSTLYVHYVTRVRFETISCPVSRHKSEKLEPER